MSCKMTVSGVIVFGVTILLFGYAKWQQNVTAPPETLEEAQKRLGRAGYFTAGLHPFGIVISKEPITHEEANHYHLLRPKEKWIGKGKARIMARPRLDTEFTAPQLSIVPWGDHLVLFGDPVFIEEIVKLNN